MKQLYCVNASCSTALNTSDEVASGLCSKCYNLLQKRHAYAVVCWQCGNPTFIDDKPTEQSRPIIKDKYIMSETCKNCAENSDGHRYMNTNSGLSKLVLGKDETLALTTDGLEVIITQAKSPEHRNVGETVPQSLGSDILTKIQIANQTAEEFLDSLEWEENFNHGK